MGFGSVDEALAEREKFIVEFEKDRDSKKSKDKTLNEVFELFVEKRDNTFGWATIRKYKSVYVNHIRENFGYQKMNEVNAFDITDYLNSLKSSHSRDYIKSI